MTKHARQIIRHHPHARIDEAHIAARAAVADFNAFQHDGVGAFSARCKAVERPVNPPPTITTSADRSPFSDVVFGAAGAVFSQRPCERGSFNIEGNHFLFWKTGGFTVATISCCGSHKNSNISATIHAYSE